MGVSFAEDDAISRLYCAHSAAAFAKPCVVTDMLLQQVQNRETKGWASTV
jgi:hypothetical protein